MKFNLKQGSNFEIQSSTNRDLLKAEEASGSALMQETTWSEIKSLRDNSQLIHGQLYRITDYVTTTAQTDTQSANHQFDIVVLALENNKLSEQAYAMLHEGDTYFANSELGAWKLWYSLDNDTARFAWADATNGKGVIYRLIDEFNNDLPYDFKNIQFEGKASVKMKRNGSYYPASMSRLESSDTTIDGTYYYAFSFNITSGPGGSAETYYTNDIYGMYDWYTISGGVATITTNVIVTILSGITVGDFYYTFTVGADDASITGTSKQVYSNIIGEYRTEYGIQKLNVNIFINSSGSLGCYSNKIGVNSHNNTIGAMFICNTIASNFYSNTSGSYFYYNTIDTEFHDNIINSSFFDNTIAQNFYYNIVGSNFSYNTIGSDFHSNTTDYNFSSNTIGSNSTFNTFGTGCSYNSFGNYCQLNTFGNYYQYNSFDNNCSHNSFGNYCQHNAFNNSCSYITFGDSSAAINYCRNIIFDNSCSYIYLKSLDTSASASNYLQNVHINSGIKGTSSSNRKTVTIPDRNLAYGTEVFLDEQSNLVIRPVSDTVNIAPLYNASSTYAVNDLCIYAGQLYKCTTAISTAEAWNSAHWTATSLAAEFASQITAIINRGY